MGRKCAVWVLVMVSVCAFLVQESLALELVLKDGGSKGLVGELFVEVNAKPLGSGDEVTYTYLVQDARVEIPLEEGAYELVVKGDDLGTRGKDYYSKEMMVVANGSSEDVFLLPVGSLMGTVTDSLDNLVENASLKFECEKDYGQTNPASTDRFGSFTNKFIPTGECKMIAAFEGGIGVTSVSIERGELLDIDIRLEQSVVSSARSGAYVRTILMIIALAGAGWLLVLRGWKRGSRQPKDASGSGETVMTKRMEDVIKTLNAREKRVVDVLLARGHEITQATLRHQTQIPKTSLARTLQTLERKKIIEVESLGRLKKARLTAWFVEK